MRGVVGMVLPRPRPGAARRVRTRRVQLGHHPRQYAQVVPLAPRVPGEPRLPAPVPEAPQVLVVAVPQHERGMRHQPYDVLPGLRLHLTPQRLLLRIGRAGEREVLPDQQPQLVAGVVEVLALVDPPAPHPYEVDTRVGRLPQPLPVPLTGDPGREHVVRDPVHAAGEEPLAVQHEREPRAVLVGRPVQPDGPETHPPPPHVQRSALVQQRQLDVVERLFPVPARPPQPRVRHLEPHAARGPVDRGACPHPVHDGLHRQRRLDPGPLHVHGQLHDSHALFDGDQRPHPRDPGRRPPLQTHRPPDPGRHQRGPPVPAERTGHLADVLIGLGVRGGPLAQPPAHRLGLGVGGDEPHREPPGHTRHVEAVRAVHVPGPAQEPAVQQDLRRGVEAVEDEVGLLVAVRGGEVPLVGPLPPPHPRDLGLVAPEEGIRDHPRRQQIGVHTARYDGRQLTSLVPQDPSLGERCGLKHVRTPKPIKSGTAEAFRQRCHRWRDTDFTG
ncbi:hypothetical protein M2163_007166 [Streptomyces sp. SAI-135]|nr:hypothetical protein [Streptomyces sp. SAI-135]